jgi:predicted nicotinamide N-methyase
MAARVLPWLRAAATRGTRVLAGDPGRTYAPDDARPLATYEVPTPIDLEGAETKRARVLQIAPQ